MSNSKVKKVLYCKTFDEYLRGYINFKFSHDISMATNYWIFAKIYKIIVDIKFQNDFKIKNAIGVSMHFDSKLEIETGGIKGFILKIALKLIRLIERLQIKLKKQ